MRDFDDCEGTTWHAQLVGHGRTSAYLNPRVHTPVVQFSRADGRGPRRYAGLPADVGPLERCSVADLRALLQRAKVH